MFPELLQLFFHQDKTQSNPLEYRMLHLLDYEYVAAGLIKVQVLLQTVHICHLFVRS